MFAAVTEKGLKQAAAEALEDDGEPGPLLADSSSMDHERRPTSSAWSLGPAACPVELEATRGSREHGRCTLTSMQWRIACLLKSLCPPPPPHPTQHTHTHTHTPTQPNPPPLLPGCRPAEEVEGGEELQAEEWLSKVAALGRSSASLSLPLLAERLQGCLAALQQCLQAGEGSGLRASASVALTLLAVVLRACQQPLPCLPNTAPPVPAHVTSGSVHFPTSASPVAMVPPCLACAQAATPACLWNSSAG